MKKALSKWYTYALIIPCLGLVALAATLPYFITNDNSVYPLVFVAYTILLSGVIYIGGGYIAQDIYRGVIRKKTNKWDFPLEDVYLNKGWSIYMPLLLSGVISLIVGFILFMLFR